MAILAKVNSEVDECHLIVETKTTKMYLEVTRQEGKVTSDNPRGHFIYNFEYGEIKKTFMERVTSMFQKEMEIICF